MPTRYTPIIFVILVLALAPACTCQRETTEETPIAFLTSPGAEGSNLPFSEAVRVGDMLYLSGQLGIPPGAGELVPGGIQPETRQVLDNIQAALERHGSSMDRVVKCTVFLADIAEWPSMNEVYTTNFPENPPARSALAAKDLAFDARVEIECMAVVK